MKGTEETLKSLLPSLAPIIELLFSLLMVGLILYLAISMITVVRAAIDGNNEWGTLLRTPVVVLGSVLIFNFSANYILTGTFNGVTTP